MKRNSKTINLTEGTVWKRLLIFLLPIAAGTLIQQLYTMVDGLIVARFVSTEALAAVGGSASQIIGVLIGFFVALTNGAAVVIAQSFGAGRTKDVKTASGNSLVICVIIGAFLTVFGLIFSPWMLSILKTPADTVDGANLYLRIYFTGVIFQLLLNMGSNILRAIGDSRSPFIYMVVGCVLNIVLDWVFVKYFNWGIAGVAIATVFSQMVNAVLTIIKLFTMKSDCPLERKDLSVRSIFLGRMMKIGVPSGFQSSMYAVSNVIFQVGVNSLGTTLVAAWSMSGKVDGFYWAISEAMGVAIINFVGQNIGAGKKDRVKQCMKQSMIMFMAFTIAISAVLLLTGRFILGILTPDKALIDATYLVMTLFVPYYAIWTVIEVFSSMLKGSGDAVSPVIITGIGICLLRILWVIFIFPMKPDVITISIGFIVSWAVTAIGLTIRYFHKEKRAQK